MPRYQLMGGPGDGLDLMVPNPLEEMRFPQMNIARPVTDGAGNGMVRSKPVWDAVYRRDDCWYRYVGMEEHR